MRLSGTTRPIIFGLMLAIGITLTLPYFAFGAVRSFGGSRNFRAPRTHGQPFFSRTFQPFGFVGVGGVDEQPVIIIQQFQPAAAIESKEPPQTEFKFSHAGWTAGMAWRSYSQDTGPTQSKR
jgi:hypothetical protein